MRNEGLGEQIEEQIRDRDITKPLVDEIAKLEKEVERLRGWLGKISEGRGRFSMDNFEHCRNTVEDMKAPALEALAPKEGE